MKLTSVIIAKNEEEIIADCIDSASFSDEILVIDNGSTDRTKELCEKLGARVIRCNLESFAEIRNVGLKKARGEWILYIDADERVTKELAEEIESVLENKKNPFSAYKIYRKNHYFGTYEWPHKDNLERLFKRKNLKNWYGNVHESPDIDGEVGQLSGLLEHYTHRSLTQMTAKTIEWSKIEAQLRLDANHPKMTWWRFPRVMFSEFFNYYIKQKGYKLGTVGLIESIYQSFSIFVTYARLWELQRNNKS